MSGEGGVENLPQGGQRLLFGRLELIEGIFY